MEPEPAIELQPLLDTHRRTAHELVRDALRRAIVTGTIPGGTRLVQTDIAAQLQVSTTPVREAMRDLATEGLIRLSAHRGATVYTLDREEVREIYALRRILEAEALRRATARITAEELEAVKSVHELMLTEQDPVKWARHNIEFHRLVTAAARSPRLVGLVESLRVSARPYIAATLPTGDHGLAAHNHQHLMLIKSIEAGDAGEASRIALEHLDATLAAYERLMDEPPV